MRSMPLLNSGPHVPSCAAGSWHSASATTSPRERSPKRVRRAMLAAVDQRALATLQDALVSHNYVIKSNLITQTRASVNRISASSTRPPW